MLNLKFENIKIDAVIFLNTENENVNKFQGIKDIPFLAADGAGISLLKKNIEPDYIIGDLDSFNSENFDLKSGFPKEKLILKEEQETNDFEKTLVFALERNYKNILIVGIHGGDYEHSLNNWSVLSKFSKKLNLVVFDNNRYGFCIDESFSLDCEQNEKISLIPMKKSKIRTTGLNWNLNNEILELGFREGARNFTLTKKITVEFEYGELFVFCEARFPKFLSKM